MSWPRLPSRWSLLGIAPGLLSLLAPVVLPVSPAGRPPPPAAIATNTAAAPVIPPRFVPSLLRPWMQAVPGRQQLEDMLRARSLEALFDPNAPIVLREAVATALLEQEPGPTVGLARWMVLVEEEAAPAAVRRLAVREALRVGIGDPAVLAVCLRVLSDSAEDLSLRLAVARHLESGGPVLESALPILLALLDDPNEPVPLRAACGRLLGLVTRVWAEPSGPMPWTALTSRLETLNHVIPLLEPLEPASELVAETLEILRPLQVSLLREHQSRRSERLMEWLRRRPLGAVVVVVALLGVGLAVARLRRPPRPAVSKSVDRLAEDDLDQTAAARLPREFLAGTSAPVAPAIAGAGEAPAAIPPKGGAAPAGNTVDALLAGILAAENPDRSVALDRLAALGDEAVAAVPALETALRDFNLDLDVRFGALTALGLLGGAARAARGTLQTTAGDTTEPSFVRLKALEHLAAVDPDNASTVRFLLERLADAGELELVRLKAGQILGTLGGIPAELQPALVRLDPGRVSPPLERVIRELQSARLKRPPAV